MATLKCCLVILFNLDNTKYSRYLKFRAVLNNESSETNSYASCAGSHYIYKLGVFGGLITPVCSYILSEGFSVLCAIAQSIGV